MKYLRAGDLTDAHCYPAVRDSKVHGPAVKLHNVPSVQRRLVFGGRKEKNFSWHSDALGRIANDVKCKRCKTGL